MEQVGKFRMERMERVMKDLVKHTQFNKTVSHEMAPSPSSSSESILNPPLTLPGHVNHVLQDGPKVLEGDSIFKSPARGIDPAKTCQPSMTSPTTLTYKRGPVRLEAAESLQLQSSAQPLSSAGIITLREVLSKSPAHLLSPIPCIGNRSPPSPAGASFRRASTDNLTTRCSPWPSKETACRCL